MASKPRIIHFGLIKNGKKIYYNNELYGKQIQSLEGKEFEEEIREKLKKPSQGTHGYYRGGIISTCLVSEKFGGWNEDEIHDLFCNLFLKTTIEKVFGDTGRTEITKVLSTSDLNQAEMNEFIERVIAWLATEGIEVLNPEQYNLTKYRKI